MKLIEQASIDKAFAQGMVRLVKIHRNSKQRWFFTLEIVEPSGRVDIYSLRPQRFDQMRTWAYADKLIDYLYARMVRSGRFILEDKES